MVKTPLPMQSEDEGYIAMANALRKDPRQLRSMLLARRKDITSLLNASKKRKDNENTSKLSAALNEIDDALSALILKPAKIAAAEDLEAEGSDEAEADDTDGDDLDETNDEEEDADEVSADSEDDSADEADVEEPEDDAADDSEESVEDAAPAVPENPVAMNTRLRKEVGDSAADFLDDYGLAIHKKVMSFFESLMTKALDLGEEDDSDGRSSLREILKEEVGKRGIRKIEPVFEEWRGVVVKQIAKDVAEMFKPPEPEPEAVSEDLPEAEEETPEATTAEPEKAAPEAPEEAGAPAATVASTVAASTPIARATGRVSFAVKAAAAKATDFKPSGFTAPRLD